jgi:hypothetical protein
MKKIILILIAITLFSCTNTEKQQPKAKDSLKTPLFENAYTIDNMRKIESGG